MMKEQLFKFNDLEIWMEDGDYYALYDAGAHQIVMRKDKISEEEAKLATSGEKGATEMMFALQARLKRAGIDPYATNIAND
jgi:hypothetical protein